MIESLVFINVLVCNIVTRYLNSFILCAEFFKLLTARGAKLHTLQKL